MNPGFASFLMRARSNGPATANALKAIERIDRVAYVPKAERARAFTDHAIGLPCGQSMERLDDLVPILVGANIEHTHRVLEIGTGSGFLTAVLAGLADHVVTLDRYRSLLVAAEERHARSAVANVTYAQRDGSKADAVNGVFDRIICTASMREFPKAFISCLSPNGAAIVPVGEPMVEQAIVRFGKVGARFERHVLGHGWFPPIEAGVAHAL